MYYSGSDCEKPTALYEANSPLGSWRDNGWKTVRGYIREAKRLAQALILNARLSGQAYTYFITTTFTDVLTVQEHQAVWKHVCDKLRPDLTALWVREPTRDNKLHYHLITRTVISAETLRQALKASIPQGYRSNIRLHAFKPHLLIDVAYYVTKARIAGNRTRDRYASKRLLFARDVRLDKFGTIGPFWVKPKQELWEQVKDHERRLAPFLAEADPEATLLATLVVQDYSLPRLRRLLAERRLRDSRLREQG